MWFSVGDGWRVPDVWEAETIIEELVAQEVVAWWEAWPSQKARPPSYMV
jgi:hypothetical protein